MPLELRAQKKKDFRFTAFILESGQKEMQESIPMPKRKKHAGNVLVIAFEFWHPLFGFFSF